MVLSSGSGWRFEHNPCGANMTLQQVNPEYRVRPARYYLCGNQPLSSAFSRSRTRVEETPSKRISLAREEAALKP